MNLKEIVTKENAREAAKIGASIAVGVGLAYMANEAGFVDMLREHHIHTSGWVGQWGADLTKRMYHYLGNSTINFDIASFGALATYILPEIVKEKIYSSRLSPLRAYGQASSEALHLK